MALKKTALSLKGHMKASKKKERMKTASKRAGQMKDTKKASRWKESNSKVLLKSVEK